MKQVIGGLTYNTDTATEIGSYDNGLGSGDFHHLEETLYQTKNGRFFIAGEGGALTRWSVPIGNNGKGGSSGIRAMTHPEALEWCEANEINADVIAQYFDIEDA